ncbi:apolipoprotein N-acyltransferase [Pelagibaculum spongiae]|uniref:Apolipoprotein N-acyltransferase n=1 Tax=Pelagibaculum spongiae TaxID=2080658 RepID=A0A2V1H586_9GAMM|nr:apolipoprotein N-acyltransferase [Pelagibaculum spongiae]PVZ72367.1 apolipoprotein N-acyltransferase [Pelagibaculum spongiae]
MDLNLPCWHKKLQQHKKTGHLIAVLAGASITAGLAPFNVWLFLLLSPVAFWLLLAGLTPKQSALRSFFYGFGLFTAGASWVYVSIHEHGNAPIILAGGLTLLFTSALALFHVLFGYLWGRIAPNKYLANLLLFSFAWTLLEVFRGWFLTGFPWLYIGYGLTDSPFSGLLPLAGVHGAGIWMVLASLLLFYALSCKNLLTGMAASLLLISGGLSSQVEWSEVSGQKTVGLVQPAIPQQDKWLRQNLRPQLDFHLQQTKDLFQKTDLVIWPETAIPALAWQVEKWIAGLDQLAKDNQATVIFGIPANTENGDGYQNVVFAVGEGSGRYNKVHLVPFGEYVPLESFLRGIIEFFNLPMSGFTAGNQNQPPLTAGEQTLGPMICYEVAYQNLGWLQAKQSDWLLTVSNDAWFGTSLGPDQHFQIVRTRALETGKPFIRVTNDGITAAIDHKGQVIQRMDRFAKGSIAVAVPLVTGTTLFMQIGPYLPILFCSFICLIAVFFKVKNRNVKAN